MTKLRDVEHIIPASCTRLFPLLAGIAFTIWALLERTTPMATYSGVRPQEPLALSWGDMRERTLLIKRAISAGRSHRPGRTRPARSGCCSRSGQSAGVQDGGGPARRRPADLPWAQGKPLDQDDRAAGRQDSHMLRRPSFLRSPVGPTNWTAPVAVRAPAPSLVSHDSQIALWGCARRSGYRPRRGLTSSCRLPPISVERP